MSALGAVRVPAAAIVVVPAPAIVVPFSQL